MTSANPMTAPSSLTERRRLRTLAAWLSSPRIAPRVDEVTYPGGHVWKRHRAHETLVLRVIAGREG